MTASVAMARDLDNESVTSGAYPEAGGARPLAAMVPS